MERETGEVMFEMMKRFKRRDMEPNKRRAIELLERSDVDVAQVSESHGAGRISVVEIKAVQRSSRRAQRFA